MFLAFWYDLSRISFLIILLLTNIIYFMNNLDNQKISERKAQISLDKRISGKCSGNEAEPNIILIDLPPSSSIAY